MALQDEFAHEQASAQETAAGYENKVRELERDVEERTAWARDTERRFTADLEAKCTELAEAVRLLGAAETTVEERTRWAQALDAKLQAASVQLAMIRSSRWVKMGRVVGLGPKLDAE